MPEKLLVSIVVLNWNSLDDTKECLASLKKIDYPNYEVIVVDNGSKDGSKEYLGRLRGIRFVDNPINRGFAGGQIDALRVAKGDILFLLNNDAVVKPDIINQALESLKDPNVGVVGGRIYSLNEESPAFNENNKFHSYQILSPSDGQAQTLNYDSDIPEEVSTVSGSCAFIKRELIEKIGYFYEPFFAYFEETDLFARTIRAGFKIIYNPKVMIWHKDGASTKGNRNLFYYYMYRNRFLFAVRNFDKEFLKPFIINYFLSGVKRILRYAIRRNPQDFAEICGFLAAIVRIPKAFKSRHILSRKLESGYNKKIFCHQGAPVTVVINCKKKTDGLSTTLAYISRQFAPPREVLVVYSKKTFPEQTPINHRAVLCKSRYLAAYDFAAIVGKYDWLLFLEPGDRINPTTILLAGLKTFRRGVGVIHPKTTSHMGLFRKNTIGRNYLIRRDVLIRTGGYTLNRESHHYLLATAKAMKIRFVPAEFEKIDDSSIDLGREFRLKLVLMSIQETLPFRLARKIKNQAWRFLTKLPKFIPIYNLLEWLVITPGLIAKISTVATLIRNYMAKDKERFEKELRKVQNELAAARYGKEKMNIGAFVREDVPIFLICRDRVSYLKQIVKRLEQAGLTNIYFVDNHSTYPPLLEYYQNSEFEVLPLERNLGQISPWLSGAINLIAKGQFYVVSDPDIVPISECPGDFLDHFHELLERYPSFMKVGFGLKIDDLPDHYPLKRQVLIWEKQFWSNELEAGVYDAGIDTTLALYRPNTWYFIHPSIRTGSPYVARHLPWYTDATKISDEDKYYRRHLLKDINSWDREQLAERYEKEMNKPSS